MISIKILHTIVAIAQISMAAGMMHFWYKWFRTEHKEDWLPAGYEEHERVFVFPDTVLSILMVTSAILLLTGKSYGVKLTLICGGMMLFLTIIDIAYFIQHGMLAKEKGGSKNLWGLVVPMIVMSILMTVPFIF
jgi:hypothetical protein